ncbi:UPF0182 family protein [Leptolyngbya sp. NIES-2104]|uniref:UPF0182 family protein n=1 Tax=Leptolyngbya sp. NIES-2104 TaxID=1552121 RepID=UPI0006ECCBDA|nr:UPF0182 family protein [Leptolyngbya sp. NIES-2104]GAP97356.1 integral membrane protein [Leptolyngbya sp. NIES-2104]
MFQNILLKVFTIALGGWILSNLLAQFGAEIFWFQEVGYLPVFLVRTATQGLIWLIVTGVTIAYFLLNLRTVEQLKDDAEAPNTIAALKLRALLPLTVVLSALIGLMLIHYGQLAWQYWQSDLATNVSLFNLSAIWQIALQVSVNLWYVGIAIVLILAILIYPQFFLTAIAIVFSILLGFLISQRWIAVLQALNPTAFNATEPLFDREISFYIFTFPVAELLSLWLVALSLYGLVSVALSYLLAEKSLSEGRFPGFSPEQQRHLFGVGSLFMFAVAFGYWLSRYELLYSSRGVTYGAGYTDVHVQLPAYIALGITAFAIALYLLWRWIFWRSYSKRRRWVSIGLVIYSSVAILSLVVPEIVQYLIVQPNELVREQPYIERTIALTRQAFGLDAIDVQTFNPQGRLREADIEANELTIRNIRLWDQRPLLDTNRQLQQIRLYYRFPDADLDRYTLQTEAPTQRPNAPTERRQVLIAARELDSSAIPEQAQTWVNRHLVYTHGYGFTISPVNTVGAGGLPEYFVKDIGDANGGALVTSSEAIRNSIPIGRPRIYYGEITDTHVMTGTRQRELDYPSGSDNTYNSYDGIGGIGIGSWWRRALFSTYLKDWRLLVTREFLPETKVLIRRNINQRIRAIAPFLKYDSNPYLVAADSTPNQTSSTENYLYWIVDAYATSDRYPYSEPTQDRINYIRNSVKVAIDAYNGSVNFYIADPNDPIIKTWSKIFPTLFKPLSAMPSSLRQHTRFPVDFFKIQSDRLMTYHMTDPQVFYNREDQWKIASEVYGNESRLVEPYYLITSLPTVPFEEFILLLPYTPQARTNLIAWLAARSDGENYGRLLLYTFPKERLVYGPEQIEARINQDPVISQQISLWNRQGSRAIQGNLLVVPIEQSLLYVEPIYLEAEQNSLPTLVRVVVAYENRIVMTPSLEESLRAIFRPDVTPTPAIIRPVEPPTSAQ